MITHIERKKKSFVYKLFCAFLSLTFIATTMIFPKAGYAQSMTGLPASGSMIMPTPAFEGVMIKGVAIDPAHPFQFDFVLDTGDGRVQGQELKTEANKLIKYFLASVTTPDKDMWVNLSPYEKDRIAPESFGNTEMGRDLLAQDYILKKFTASLIYPEGELGKKFWDRVYKKAYERFGTTDIPANTFNKVWVIPDKAVVYEHQGKAAFVVERHLKVMLEEDYVALEKSTESRALDARGLALDKNLNNKAIGAASQDSAKSVSALSSDIVREIVLPEIEKEVNYGKNFANLRQIYNAMILSTWYKRSLKETIFGQVYADKNKIAGVDVNDRAAKQKIYDQYLETFRKGVYSLIKVDYDAHEKRNVAHKYFSGGCQHVSSAVTVKKSSGDLTGLQQFNLVQKSGPLVVASGGVRSAKNDDPQIVSSPLKTDDNTPQSPAVDDSARVSRSIASSSGDTSDTAQALPSDEGRKARRPAAIRWAEVLGYSLFMPFHLSLLSGLALGTEDLHSTGINILLSLGMMVIAALTQISFHENDHLNKGVEVGSLKDKELREKLFKQSQQSFWNRIIPTIGRYLGMPFGLVKGVKLNFDNISRIIPSYEPQLKPNVYSDAWGVRGDRIRALISLPVAVVLLVAGGVTLNPVILFAGQTVLAFFTASILSFALNDPGAYAALQDRIKTEKDKAAELASKGGAEVKAKSGSLEERDETWGGRKEDLQNIFKNDRETRMQERRAKASLLYPRYVGRRAWDVVVRLPRQWRNSWNGGAHADKRFPKNSMSFQEGMFLIRGAKDGLEAQSWAERLQTALQHELEESGGEYMGLGDEGGVVAGIAGKPHENDRNDELGRKMAKLPEVEAWRCMARAIVRAGLRPWVDVTLALDGAATQLEDMYIEQIAGKSTEDPDAPIGKYYFYKSRLDKETATFSGDEIIEMLRRMIVDYDVPFTSFEDIVSERDLDAQKRVNKVFKGLVRIVIDDAAVTNSKNVERIVENEEGDTLLVKPNQIGDRLGLLEALVTATVKNLKKLLSHRSQSPIDLMEPETAMAHDADGVKVGGAYTGERITKYNETHYTMSEFEERAARLESGMFPQMTEEQRKADEDLNRAKKGIYEVTKVEVRKGNVNTALPTADVTVSFGIPGSYENQFIYSAKALTPIGASDGLGEAVHAVDKTFWRFEIPEGTKYMHMFERMLTGAFQFKKSTKRQDVEKTGNAELLALFDRTIDFGGKDIEVAMATFKKHAVDLLMGVKYSDIVDWQKLEAVIQQKELELYRQYEAKERAREEADNVPSDQRLPQRTDEEVVLRKATLGMQNMLAASFARHRLAAQLQGLKPWELERLIYRESLAKVIAANGGLEIIPEEIRDEMVPKDGEALWETIEANLSLEELEKISQAANNNRPEGMKSYEMVRQALDITFSSSPAGASSNVGGVNLNSNLLDLQIKRDAAGSPLPISEQPIFNMDIQGFSFTIKTMTPITSVPMFLGMHKEKSLEETFAEATL